MTARETPMNDQRLTVVDLDARLSAQSPQQILAHALAHHDNIAISFSGAEDVVLVDMAFRIRQDIQVFSLDTGRLHPETYQFIERVRDHYGIPIETLFPDAAHVQTMVREKGLRSEERRVGKESRSTWLEADRR